MQSLYDNLKALVEELDRLPNDHPQWAGSPMREDCIRALIATEQSGKLTAFGCGLRSRFANWLVSLGRSLANIGGN